MDGTRDPSRIVSALAVFFVPISISSSVRTTAERSYLLAGREAGQKLMPGRAGELRTGMGLREPLDRIPVGALDP
jgi:hypothetical protein